MNWWQRADTKKVRLLVCITRYVKKDELSSSSTEALIEKKKRLLCAFADYETKHIKILSLDNENEENVGDVENKYYDVLTALNEEIKRRDLPRNSDNKDTVHKHVGATF